MSDIEITETHKVHGGTLSFVRHASAATGGHMTFSIFVPEGEGPFPTLYWLSGLTCSASNFTEKAGAYQKAAALKLIVVAPDTSPRGDGVANDEAYDLGQGAGFYVDATQAPWKAHFRMETYVTADLLAVVEANFPADPARRGVSGHSMGGHGALTIAMNHAHLFHSVSAFAPISAPSRCPWGQKAFGAYLGSDHAVWERHDASLLMAAGAAKPYDAILVDQGTADTFLESQLMPSLLEQAAAAGGANLTLRYQDGYDHSYYFIQSFIDDHLAFHAERLARV
ncbi:S-formylglutathione hydrolase [Asticcacaulis solisilvae]|uniref:S-formylglutathione hydrolase n=1 Tax=Asticcacaulis solisilvae TaxID=1217274 RepID=UPI003FD750C4